MSIQTEIKHRILVLDGAMGTMIQKYGLSENDYRGTAFTSCTKELKGNNECLNLSRPDIIKAIHQEYIAAGADIIESNTFSANRISQSEYGCEDFASEMAYQGAKIAREAADETEAMAKMIGLSRKIWVAGSIGPTSKSLSLSPEVSDPAFRPYSFDDMKQAYKEQAEALIRGGVDIILIETCFDALNVKAALAAVKEASLTQIPVIVSVSVSDRSGRTLTGQTMEAFYTSVCHYPLLAFGLNCSLGATELTPLMEDAEKWCGCALSCYPNAGLPNEMGGYDQSPEDMAEAVKQMAEKGLLNIIGGCCGTTPGHIKAIADAVRGISPHAYTSDESENKILKVSGLESVTVDVEHNNFTNVGERTNVAGSRKFARLISENKYDEALQIAAKQIEDGAAIIDINMDDAMLDSTREMEKFVRHISNDPAVAKAALMIDSSHWDTILAGLKNAQGKCIVNSISLKEGEESFIEKAKVIASFGAAVVVMAFDEEGQATSYDRKVEISSRAYRLLTEKAGISPENIIFDVNILSIGTGIEEHANYAVDFIEAVRWIKQNLPGALTSGGVSNLSFAFRGNNAVREAMHSAFLYHAIAAGLDMAIVNPSMLQVYDEIDPELLVRIEDVIFNRDAHATERLIEKASEMLAAGKDTAAQQQEIKSNELPVNERLKMALVKGVSSELAKDLQEALAEDKRAVDIIEGPLMEGMETVGRLFGEGKMFLPQVVKSAKVMRDAVDFLNPYLNAQSDNDDSNTSTHPKVLIATVKGDVHDIGKNITGIVLNCNGFEVKDLGVMVDKETILAEAETFKPDIIAVSGLITPSLFQMEELCREMTARNMHTPLMIGGATTSALHTAVKLAPLYSHVFYGPDASAAAVMAKKYILDPEGFEKEQHERQQELRDIYNNADTGKASDADRHENCDEKGHETKSFTLPCPKDIPVMEIPAAEILPYFDWKMFFAIWGVKYGSAVPEAMELMMLRRDAEDELETGNFRIKLSARFFMGHSTGKEICFKDKGNESRLPFMRQEKSERLSLCDFVASAGSGAESPFGVFAISVPTASKTHEEGCCCPACSNRYEDMVGKAVRMTLAEAASKWLDRRLADFLTSEDGTVLAKVIKPAAGYASCPDHTLKQDILKLLGEDVVPHDCHGSNCSCHSHNHSHEHKHEHKHEYKEGLNIKLTESYAMTPEASICGFIFMHPEASYPDIRSISRERYEEYAKMRGMEEDTARRFLGHLL